MRPHLPRVEPGDPITAAAYNRLVDAVNAVLSMTASGASMSHGPGGLHLALPRVEKIWLFEVTSSSPTAASGGDRYWTCDRMRLNSTPTWAQDNPTGYQLFDPTYDKNRDIIHLDGETMIARFNDDTGRWETIWADCSRRLGKTDAAHNKAASGTVSIYSGTPGSETDTTLNVTAWNKFANVGSGKWCWLNHERNGWYLTAAEC